MTTHNIIIAFVLTIAAGLATGAGSLIALAGSRISPKVLSASLGLAAAVMIYISLAEIIPESMAALADPANSTDISTDLKVLTAFLAGIAFMALIDFLVPESENSHVCHGNPADAATAPTRLKRAGIMLTLAIAAHNLPEGIATFVSALDGLDVALPIVIAISIHNIPMGIAMSAPIYGATGSRARAFFWPLAAGMASVAGALLAWMFLLPMWTPEVASLCMASVAGIMVFVAFDELLPGAEAYGHHRWAMTGIIAGLALMGLSLILLH